MPCPDNSKEAWTPVFGAVALLLFLGGWYVVAWKPFLAKEEVKEEEKEEEDKKEEEGEKKKGVVAKLKEFAKVTGKKITAYVKLFIGFWQVATTGAGEGFSEQGRGLSALAA